jgi:tetratricopeptide (TPR) repeat protein
VSEHAGTGREAVLVQHLGKAYFAAGDYRSAVVCFERALTLRTADGVDSSLVESSRMALQRARQLERPVKAAIWAASGPETGPDAAQIERPPCGCALPDEVGGERAEVDVEARVSAVVGEDLEAAVDEDVVLEIGVTERVDGETDA